jgi:hypothetical protein
MAEGPRIAPIAADRDYRQTAVDISQFLSDNPTIAAALQTFQVAQEEYRRSVTALVSTRVVTSRTTSHP